MLESVLTRKNAGLKVKISVKTAVAVLIVALAVGLPQIVHLIAGAQGGATWLPMYLPVLIGGCLLGPLWGLGVGVLSPVVSFAITAMAGEAMPAAVRLPFMTAELAVFAAVSGAFSKKISDNMWMAFPAVLLAQVAGRTAYITLVAVFSGVAPITVGAAWAQIQTGFIGLIAQAVIVPFVIMGLCLLFKKDKE